jgi:hypothetical protein
MLTHKNEGDSKGGYKPPFKSPSFLFLDRERKREKNTWCE